VATEVAAAERHVATVGEPESVSRQLMSHSAQNAGLADAGLPDEQCMATVVTCLNQALDSARTRGRDPQVRVGDLLKKALHAGPTESAIGS
jgi:hypothetical protein